MEEDRNIVYYWTLGLEEPEEEKGKFYFWESKSEKIFHNRANRFYEGRKYDFGHTIKDTYDKGRKA